MLPISLCIQLYDIIYAAIINQVNMLLYRSEISINLVKKNCSIPLITHWVPLWTMCNEYYYKLILDKIYASQTFVTFCSLHLGEVFTTLAKLKTMRAGTLREAMGEDSLPWSPICEMSECDLGFFLKVLCCVANTRLSKSLAAEE